MVSSLIRSSYKQGFARNASESALPRDWKGLVRLWLPTLRPSGVTLRDWSGYGSHRTLTTMDLTTVWAVDAEQGGYVLQLGGSNDYVELGNPASLYLLGDFTILANVYPTQVSTYDVVLGKDVSGQRDFAFGYSVTTQELVFFDGVTGDVHETNTTPLLVNTWQTIGVTPSGADYRLYVDGTLERTIAGTASAFTTTNNVNIGRREFAANEQNMDANLAWLRIYNGALSKSHIQEIQQDQQGIVRLAEAQDFLSVAAAGGATVPIFHHH